jgi:hypothetical protein
MRYKTLFRVLLKLIGVLIFVEGMFGTLSIISQLLNQWSYRGSIGPNWVQILLNCIYSLGKVAVGLYFFFGGAWVADKAIPGNRPYCHECGYDLTNASGTVCSECGTPMSTESLKQVHASSEPQAMV